MLITHLSGMCEKNKWLEGKRREVEEPVRFS